MGDRKLEGGNNAKEMHKKRIGGEHCLPYVHFTLYKLFPFTLVTAWIAFNMDLLRGFIAKLPLILGVLFSWNDNYWSYVVAVMRPSQFQTYWLIIFFEWPSRILARLRKFQGPFKKINYISLTARSQQKRTMLVCIPTYFLPNFFIFKK